MGCMPGSPKQKTVAATLYGPGRTWSLFLAPAGCGSRPSLPFRSPALQANATVGVKLLRQEALGLGG